MAGRAARPRLSCFRQQYQVPNDKAILYKSSVAFSASFKSQIQDSQSDQADFDRSEMSESGPSHLKSSWRQKFGLRHSKSPKRSSSPPAVSSSSTPPTSSVTQVGTPSAVPFLTLNAHPVFDLSAPKSISVPPTSPAAPIINPLLQSSLDQLSDKERTTIEKFLPHGTIEIQSALQAATDAANDKQKACLDKRWSFILNGKKVILRERADKVIHWLDRFKSIGDVASNADPVHVGLPWAGIRFLLETAMAESNQMAALLIGCEIALYMASRLQVYVEFWQKLPVETSQRNLEASLANMYAFVLKFLARALLVYDTSTIKRTLSAMWQIDEVTKFENEVDKLAVKVQNDASNCDRNAHFQQMQDVLTELQKQHQMQISLDRLHLKIDLDKIKYAPGAIFNSSDGIHRTCHPKTRIDLLTQVQEWAQQPDGKSIFWLHGGAGTGKSTISWTFCKWLTDQKEMASVQLGASFFFKRGEGERGSSKRFFPTIVRQLITKIPGLDVLVAPVIESDPFIFDKAIGEQFLRLILQPLQDLSIRKDNLPTLVVVADALDECEEQDSDNNILKLWSQLSQRTAVNLRLLLTCRYEPSIRLQFRKLSPDLFENINLIDAVSSSTIQKDLSVYLNDTLLSIRERFNNYLIMDGCLDDEDDSQDNWVNSDTIRELVEMSVPLFIVAATICRFIEEGSDPQKRLEEILRNKTVAHMTQMEKAYLPVLAYLTDSTVNDKTRKERCRDFRELVGSIIVCAEPLSKESLASLLNMSVKSISLLLAPLGSVLHIPANLDSPVRTFHLSFAEFLLTDEAPTQPFEVYTPSAHLALSRHCLRVMSSPGGLRENICDLEHPGQLRHEVKSTIITGRLSHALQYACRYWAQHVKNGPRNDSEDNDLHDNGKVHNFLKEHLLHWIEALSLMGYVSEAIHLLLALQSCVSKVASSLSAFLEDARRFVLTYRHIADVAPLQLYLSAMIFAPHNSLVRTVCGQSPPQIQPHLQIPTEWGPALQSLEGHVKEVRSLVFSPNGSLLASGSNDDTIRLWDVQTGREIQKIEGPYDFDNLVFSSDELLLSSGFWDLTIRIWDIQTSQEIRKLENGSSSEILVCSPDGSLVASTFEERTIRVWDVCSGQEAQKLEGRAKVLQLIFLPCGSLLASVCGDATVRLWSIVAGQEIQKIESLDIYGRPAFSPNGSLFAFCSADDTIRLWDIQSSREVKKLEGHSSTDNYLVFLPNGSLLAAIEFDGLIVQLWDMQTEKRVQRLERHSEPHTSLAFSPSGSLLASVSASTPQIIGLWDIQSICSTQKLEGHSQTVYKTAFSPDGHLLASGSSDNTARLWDVKTGQEIWKLEEYFSGSSEIAFSPDGSFLASGSYTGDVRVWSIQTRQEVQKLDCDASQTKEIVFSSDGNTLASRDSDGMIWLWNVQTGQEVQRVKSVRSSRPLYFNDNNSLIVFTDREILEIGDEVTRKPNDSHISIGERGDWIQRGGQRLFWLPPEYRGRSEIHGDVLALSSATGRVSIFRLSDF
ncbi:MAG: hypothetical protein M1814_001089 [Vezdaea aestivalis]|nr:MAG: hypothetical protein M1814_001089 [Vezdaea aestivalis]